jgi:antitoxin component YwqK of YwqJK toxin-antitoxin module
MKFHLYVILFLVFLSSVTISAQKTWLDKDLKETEMSKALFYKVVFKNDPTVSYFYKSGNIFRKYNIIARKIEGKYAEFYETGELKIAGRYKNGLQEGLWKIYTKKGKIKEKGNYGEGKKKGVWKTYYKDKK